jgi:hypothetical protein
VLVFSLSIVSASITAACSLTLLDAVVQLKRPFLSASLLLGILSTVSSVAVLQHVQVSVCIRCSVMHCYGWDVSVVLAAVASCGLHHGPA